MDIAKSSSHVYTPLWQPTNIRIAIIEPSMDPDAPLRVTFHQACLDDLEGRYEAVSYVWGAPILCFPVYDSMDGSHLLITENLDHALRRLRHKADPRWLWADAICIDQKNNREKAIQIPLMVQIFRGATRVLAWLHDSDEALETAMHSIDHVSRRLHRHRLEIEEDIGTDNGNTHHHVADILVLFQLPYFRRLWIIQEIAFNVEITLICGKTQLSWFRMYTVLQSYRSRRLIESSQSGMAGIRAVCLAAEEWSRNCLISKEPSTVASRRHILDLVSASDMYQCTDARDRIFALYSLANHETAHMEIDYSLDVYATYRNFALACMANGRTLDVLNAALERLDTTSSTEWPSWVPDWRRNTTRLSLPIPREHANTNGPLKVSTGTIYKDVVELKIKSYKENLKYLPLLIHTEGMIRMQESALVFLQEFVNLFRAADMPNETELSRILGCLWPLIDYQRRSQLYDLIGGSWDGRYKEHDEEVHVYAQPLLDYIAAIAHGYSCFVAKFEGSSIPYVCYGRAGFAEGDMLVPVELFIGSKYYSILRMCVLRPVVRPAKQNPLTRHHTHWTATQFRVVGEALTFYPTQKQREFGLPVPFNRPIHLC
jgi:hypothetical protein